MVILIIILRGWIGMFWVREVFLEETKYNFSLFDRYLQLYQA